MLELVDYGGGNLGSLCRCLERLGQSYRLVDAQQPPSGDRPVILPGVGAFGSVVQALAQGGLDQRLRAIVAQGTPFLGICVGLQVLFDSSQESPGVAGLGILPGRVVRLQAPKVPQIGWNRIECCQEPSTSGFVYFVNSYVAQPQDPQVIWYQADYYGPFCAAVRRGNVSAFQFHPEKSGPFGQGLVGAWCQEVVA